MIELHLLAKRKLGKARASLVSAALAVLFTPAITIRSLSMARAFGIWQPYPSESVYTSLEQGLFGSSCSEINPYLD